MSGYTPVFESIYDGTLHGRWPTAAVWASLLPLVNKDGEIRMTLEAISARTGWPMKFLKQGIQELMQPDADSQSDLEEGRRLVPIDPRRTWGWRVVNHAKYREKARKQNHDKARVESGENAERMKERRETEQALSSETRRDPPSPDATRRDPLSDSYADTVRERPRKRGTRLPGDFEPDPETALQILPDLDVATEAQRFRDYWAAKSGASAVKTDWPATWRNWVRNCKDSGRYAKNRNRGGVVC